MKFRTILTCSLAALTIGLMSCEKKKIDELIKWQYSDQATNANIKLINTYAWLTPSFTTTNPSLTAGQHLYLYRDTFKLNGNPNSYGGVWPGPVPYSLNPAGTFNFRLVWAKQVGGIPTPTPGDTIVNKVIKLDAGKFYSFFITDSIPNADLVVVNDEYVTDPPVGTYRIRFGNFVPNTRDTVSIFSRREGKVIFQDVLYKQVTPFIQLNIPSVSDTFDIQRRGVGANPYTGTNLFLAFSPVSLRSYTIFTRGNPRVSGRSATIASYTNR